MFGQSEALTAGQAGENRFLPRNRTCSTCCKAHQASADAQKNKWPPDQRHDSKAVVTGDVSQIDLPKTQFSGLINAERVLKRVDGNAICRMTSADVVRLPLVARLVNAYDAPGPSATKRS